MSCYLPSYFPNETLLMHLTLPPCFVIALFFFFLLFFKCPLKKSKKSTKIFRSLFSLSLPPHFLFIVHSIKRSNYLISELWKHVCYEKTRNLRFNWCHFSRELERYLPSLDLPLSLDTQKCTFIFLNGGLRISFCSIQW